jgi:hypothetical protein
MSKTSLKADPRLAAAPTNFTYLLVDLYIDPGSSITTTLTTPPTRNAVTTHGNCYGYLQSVMAPGTMTSVQIDHWWNNATGQTGLGCPIPSGIHTFYAQVDTCYLALGQTTGACYDPSNGIYGYVVELNEDNNIGGPYFSTFREFFFPLLFR